MEYIPVEFRLIGGGLTTKEWNAFYPARRLDSSLLQTCLRLLEGNRRKSGGKEEKKKENKKISYLLD